jgi:hypothetical protein
MGSSIGRHVSPASGAVNRLATTLARVAWAFDRGIWPRDITYLAAEAGLTAGFRRNVGREWESFMSSFALHDV